MIRILLQQPPCPSCGQAMSVSGLRCLKCDLSMTGSFESCRFCQVGPETRSFIEAFLRCEGNLSKLEKEVGLSYPTLRNRLLSALEALGLRGDQTETVEVQKPVDREEAHRRSVLERLELGEIDAPEAARLLTTEAKTMQTGDDDE